MKYLIRLTLVLGALMFPVMVISEPAEERDSTCDASFSEYMHLSIAQIHERLVNLSWPDILPPLSQASMNAYALFQIKVSTTGDVCFIESKFGSPLIVHPLTPEIKKWKFSPNKPFWGVIVIRYKSGRGYQLL
jgi:hypothetical protein